MLGDVKQATIKPLIVGTVEAGTQVYTDEYVIYGGILVVTARLVTSTQRNFPREMPIYLSLFEFVHNSKRWGRASVGILSEHAFTA